MKIRYLIFTLFIVIGLSGCKPSTQKVEFEFIGPKTELVTVGNYHQIRYVSDKSGSDTEGNGTISTPWKTIAHALRQISDAGADRQYAVLVAGAIYYHTPIKMKQHIHLFGGFDPASWQRNIKKYLTVLTGRGEHRVIIGSDFSRLDGFVITDGQIRGKGAGMLCSGTSPVVTNNQFIKNKTLAPDPWRPQFLHEIANDGGAIYVENGSAPIIENNIFINNSTDIGRGAAIAFHSKSSGRIANNVFMENKTGLRDSMRSSDGGAISVFKWSSPVVENNIILNNEALNRNDAGGMFVALWSSPLISKNIFAGNRCGDDGGALFVGGQEHRYDRSFDPMPGKEQFFVQIMDNVFIGNENPSKNSGAMRFTMESRGLFFNNIVAHNTGIYFQRCEVLIENNKIFDNFLCVETKKGLTQNIIRNNIMWGDFVEQTDAEVTNCTILGGYKGKKNTSLPPKLVNDGFQFQADAVNFLPMHNLTSVFVSSETFQKNELCNRVIWAGDKLGVISSNEAQNINIWGDFTGQISFIVLPSYRLQ
ncbi:MAG TPA: DUF1565 domain-containing protein [bacterium]|mgnify:CR=1 FL=1|nr:DUF1565 domain-containing protein [bacterium]